MFYTSQCLLASRFLGRRKSEVLWACEGLEPAIFGFIRCCSSFWGEKRIQQPWPQVHLKNSLAGILAAIAHVVCWYVHGNVLLITSVICLLPQILWKSDKLGQQPPSLSPDKQLCFANSVPRPPPRFPSRLKSVNMFSHTWCMCPASQPIRREIMNTVIWLAHSKP